MSKSSCLICTNMILGGGMPQQNFMKREARLCQKHGSMGYPTMVQCILCRMSKPKPKGTTTTVIDHVPINICLECWMAGGSQFRCCAMELE